MKSHTKKRFFPDSEAFMVDQNGTKLSAPSKGIEIILHSRENEHAPCCAELISGVLHAEIGLWFEGKKLSDYDGIFSLPREVGEMLRDAGYFVPEECFG